MHDSRFLIRPRQESGHAGLGIASKDAEAWTLQASILPREHGLVGLHESLDLRRVGVRERIGVRGGRWRGTVILERRSALAEDSEGLPA